MATQASARARRGELYSRERPRPSMSHHQCGTLASNPDQQPARRLRGNSRTGSRGPDGRLRNRPGRNAARDAPSSNAARKLRAAAHIFPRRMRPDGARRVALAAHTSVSTLGNRTASSTTPVTTANAPGGTTSSALEHLWSIYRSVRNADPLERPRRGNAGRTMTAALDPFVARPGRRLLLGGRLLAGLDGGRVTPELTRQPVAVRGAEQRLVHALNNCVAGSLGEGAREDRLARRLALPLPPADAPQRRAGAQAVHHRAPRRHVVDRLGHTNARAIAARSFADTSVPATGDPLLDTDDLEGLHQLLPLFSQRQHLRPTASTWTRRTQGCRHRAGPPIRPSTPSTACGSTAGPSCGRAAPPGRERRSMSSTARSRKVTSPAVRGPSAWRGSHTCARLVGAPAPVEETWRRHRGGRRRGNHRPAGRVH